MPPTKEKLEAFEKYDFGSDERWINYYNNLVIPPGRSDGAAIVRRYKQKFYQKNVDAAFEVETLSESARATSSSSSSSSQSSAPRAPAASSTPSRATNTSPPPSPGPQFQRTAGTTMATPEFLGQAWVVIMAVVAVFPLSPPSLAMRCFRLCLVGSIMNSAYNVYKKYGGPRGFSWEFIKLWLQMVFSGPEILTLMHCTAFLPSVKPVGMACVPLACHLAPSLAEYLQQNFSRAQLYQQYLEKWSQWLTSNKVQVELFAANMEISLGFMVIIFLLGPQRNLFQAFFYWQLLRLEYQSPASSWYHQQNWAQLGAKVEPLLSQYAPFFLVPIGYVKRWFTNV